MSIKSVKDIYNRVAINTGFPIYSNDTDTPDINRFLLQCISEALHALIDRLYISNNVLERKDVIKTIEGEELYGIDGIVKKAQLVKNGKIKQLPYLNNFPKDKITPFKVEKNEEGNVTAYTKDMGEPHGYIIESGYLRLIPCPDKEYTVHLTLSTTDLVMSDNDAYRETVESIDDNIIADDRFCNLIILMASMLIFSRCQNANSQIYATLLEDRVRTYIERDYGSSEASRLYNRRQGHYDPKRGLLG